ncbi:MAG: DUF2828 family protein [Ruminococcus sp.]|nr:DUF2828 family protein [Ruminococcus sp.]
MLDELKRNASLTETENGAVTLSTSGSCCMDLFFRAGAMRHAGKSEIRRVVLRAAAEDLTAAMKILFFARDIRGGLGERSFFRTAMEVLAKTEPAAVERNIHLFPEYGRFDDLLVLLGTRCEKAAVDVLKTQLDEDIKAMADGRNVSLLAKWLPSVNTSSAASRQSGKKLAKLFGMTEKQYRQTLSGLRRYIDIIENRLRESDYSFDYSSQPSRAMLKYRKAFIRNDEERYCEFISQAAEGKVKLHADTLYPYDIVRPVLISAYGDREDIPEAERAALNASWLSLPSYGADGRNALAVVDCSGSMYGEIGNSNLRAIDVSVSLGIYFAEHNTGEFAGHFISFSEKPELVRVKGRDIAEKALYCSTYNDPANTDIEAVFNLILDTAVRSAMPQSEMPEILYIISDMEFDYCADGGDDMTMFEEMRQLYRVNGYELPQIVFWCVDSRHDNFPVSISDTGVALMSGASPSLFDMVMSGETTPLEIMNNIINSERYAAVR